MLRRLLLVAILMLALSTAACTAGTSGSSQQAGAPAGAATSAATTTAPGADTSGITPMTIAEKQKLIERTFQAEVPVPMGKVMRGEAQGPLAWDYELVVAAPVAAVAEWYKSTYVGREWKVAEEMSPSPGTVRITLTKNAAQTQVTISPEGSGSSRVKAILGVGSPVLQTQ